MTAPTLIALISQKGGSGKTTVAMQLAAGLPVAGYRVALADLDPPQSASRSAAASSPLAMCVAASPMRVCTEIGAWSPKIVVCRASARR